MHPYSTDSKEREFWPFLFAVLSIPLAWALHQFFGNLGTYFWLLDAPSVFGFYGILYRVFDTWIWKIPVFRKFGIPNLSGIWTGYVRSSFDNYATRHAIMVSNKQNWRSMIILLESDESASRSEVASIIVGNPDGPVLVYEYLNEPSPASTRGMQVHHGVARLVLTEANKLVGGYYSGRGRHYGEIFLKKKS
jgi:hypothetical protein